MLTYDPLKRITAAEALEHPYFTEYPPPCPIVEMPYVLAPLAQRLTMPTSDSLALAALGAAATLPRALGAPVQAVGGADCARVVLVAWALEVAVEEVEVEVVRVVGQVLEAMTPTVLCPPLAPRLTCLVGPQWSLLPQAR